MRRQLVLTKYTRIIQISVKYVQYSMHDGRSLTITSIHKYDERITYLNAIFFFVLFYSH